MSLGASLKRMDFYRRVPKDLTEPTAPGAIISIVACVVMLSLFVGEVNLYLNPPTRTDMFIALDQGEKLKVNLNMTFHALPCFVCSLDVVDIMGRHEMGVSNTAKKIRIAKDGSVIGPYPEHPAEDTFNGMLEEGCRLEGHIFINKVPGNFHVSAHGLQQHVFRYMGGNIHLQHTIHHFFVGDIEFVGDHGFEGQVHPLNGVTNPETTFTNYEYYLDIVPTVYRERRGKEELRAYQIAYNMHSIATPPGHMTVAYFRYQMSPITVKYGREKSSFFHFLTYVCAIIGGTFTVAGILSRLVHSTAVQIQRRVLGKDT